MRRHHEAVENRIRAKRSQYIEEDKTSKIEAMNQEPSFESTSKVEVSM
jgi:hypothetical protein